MASVKPFKICGEQVTPGTRKRVHIQSAKLYDHTETRVPIEVIHGKKSGPVLFVSGAVHGDEINGVEVCRQLLLHRSLNKLKGTLLVVPIVNPFGYNNLTRYMPDRRDLNRAFPGNSKGSLTSQLAYHFMKEVVKRSNFGIDLHTGALHRTNLPQIRANLDDEETLTLAREFGCSVAINAKERDGSLRQAAAEEGVKVLLFEGGTALRHQEMVIRTSLRGIFKVMRTLGMLPGIKAKVSKHPRKVFLAQSSFWVRGAISGSLRSKAQLGDPVKKGQLIGTICDPFGEQCAEVRAPGEGVIIGQRVLPLINRGDAIFHIASISHDEIPDGLEFHEPDIGSMDFRLMI